MTASLAMMGAKAGFETAVAFNQAFQSQAQAQLQSGALQRQMEEIDLRTKMQIRNIYKQSEKVQSAQTAAFTAGGVELSGSAMSVVSDTINDAAEAAYIRQRESDYDLMVIGMQKHGYDKMASNETLMLNLASATIGGVTSFAKSYAKADMKKQKSSIGDDYTDMSEDSIDDESGLDFDF